MVRLLALLLLADLALMVVALIDCLSTDGDKIRALPKIAWTLLIVLFSPVSSIAWFTAGRPTRRAARRSAWHPAGSAASPPRRPLAPDDDPEFLRQLAARTRRPDQDILRNRDEGARRLEEERRRRDSAGEPEKDEG